MQITLKEITVRDVSNGYKDTAEEGVVGYNKVGEIDRE